MFEWFISRFSLSEISGSLGDLGTFLPIVVGMSKKGVINIGSTFFWAGCFNIITGLLWDSPIPVQPMKTIASAAIAGTLTEKSVMTAGFLTSAIVFLLGITNTIQFVSTWVPAYLISAIQMGQGLAFITQGIKMITGLNTWIANDCFLISICFGMLILFTWCPWNKNSTNLTLRRIAILADKIPTALILFIVGCIMASVNYSGILVYSITNPFISVYKGVTSDDFLTGFQKGTVPQFPLTLLNSVLSVVELNNELFPEKIISIQEMATSVGLMNMIGVWFGSMPNCHGSGGLASQYRFGARNGLSIILLGILKCFIGIFLGSALNQIISAFPLSILGLMLTVTGAELASRGSNKIIHQDDILTYSITVGIMITLDLYTGFIVGFVIHLIKKGVYLIHKKYDIELFLPTTNDKNIDIELSK